jgi:hypothetical protein
MPDERRVVQHVGRERERPLLQSRRDDDVIGSHGHRGGLGGVARRGLVVQLNR